MKFCIFVFIASLLSVNIKAQTVEDSVKSAVMSLFDAMKTSNGPQLKAAFADSAILQTIVSDKSGKTVIRNQNIQAFADIMARQVPGDADERIVFETVKVDGDLALAWTPYKFYYKGSFSHCGVNSFHLVRLGGEWKIQHLIDTRRKADCK